LVAPEATARLLVAWVRRHAVSQPAPPRRLDAIGERLTRPFALQAGAVRNTHDAVASVKRGWFSRRQCR
jgi:hypothetical protein